MPPSSHSSTPSNSTPSTSPKPPSASNTLSSSTSTALSGLLFGAALTVSSVYSPQIIIAQMKLRDFHMLKVFLTASASSALIIPLLSTAHARPPATIKHLPPYSANALGGLLLGLGMTLTGACPGTVFPQLAVGILSGLFVLLGGILGGVLWVTFRTSLRQGSQPVHAAQSIGSKGNGERTGNRNPTLSPALMAYISLCLLAITVATFLAPFTYAAPIHPILGGLLIGAAQASSILLTGSTLGVSTAYEDAAAWLRYWIQNSESANPPQTSRSDKASKPFPRPPTKSLCFVVGVLAGSYSVLKLSPHQLASRSFGSVGEGIAEGDVQVGKLTAVLGGCIMIFGARLAGGCTSGHGISGMAMLGPASFVTVGGMFVGGMGLAVLRG